MFSFTCQSSIGVLIEEITEEDETVSPVNHESSSEYSGKQHQESEDARKVPINGDSMGQMTNSESLEALKGDPDAIRYSYTILLEFFEMDVCIISN